MMTRSFFMCGYGTYPDQNIKCSGLDKETQYFACHCRSTAIGIKAQRLAIFPTAHAYANVSSMCAGQQKIQSNLKMTRTHQHLIAMMDVAMTLVSRDSTRLLTWAMSIVRARTLWI